MTCSWARARSHSSRSRRRTSVAASSSRRAGCLAFTRKISKVERSAEANGPSSSPTAALNTFASTSVRSEPRSTLPISPPCARVSAIECSRAISWKQSGSSASTEIISLALPSPSRTMWLTSMLSNLGELSLKYACTGWSPQTRAIIFSWYRPSAMKASNSSSPTRIASRYLFVSEARCRPRARRNWSARSWISSSDTRMPSFLAASTVSRSRTSCSMSPSN
jgi:hypothetical protein